MDWLALLGGFFSGLITGWTLKVVITNRSVRKERSTEVLQQGNVAGGNIVAGDMKSRE